jgi:hypothetical protein
MSSLPGPVRATLGLAVVAVENARSLPTKAVEVPVAAVTLILQSSLRAQQRYAELTMRGDELIGRLRGTPDEPPAWATFDEPPEANNPPPASAPPAESEPTSPAARRATPGSGGSAGAVRPRKAAGEKRRAAGHRETSSAQEAKAVVPRRDVEPSAFDTVGDLYVEPPGAFDLAERSGPFDLADGSESVELDGGSGLWAPAQPAPPFELAEGAPSEGATSPESSDPTDSFAPRPSGPSDAP